MGTQKARVCNRVSPRISRETRPEPCEKGPAAQKCFFISPRPQGGTKASSLAFARSARSARSLAGLLWKKGRKPFPRLLPRRAGGRVLRRNPGGRGDHQELAQKLASRRDIAAFLMQFWASSEYSRSWPVLASANRGDWFVRNSKRFCRSFHLSRNDEIASQIVARDPF